MLVCMVAACAYAEENDYGLQLGADATYKINKKWSVGAEAAMRTRNDFRTMDRWSAGVDVAYKWRKYLKFSAGYAFLYDNNEEKINYDESGTLTKWRPSYWGIRHRFSVSATGSIDAGRFSFSLRERWQYTYRPQKTVDRYDFSDEEWEDKIMNSTNRNVLRSRIQVEYDIPKCKVDPYVSAEFYNSMRLQKTRIIAGVEWKITKKHALDIFYRCQFVNNDDDNEKNTHIIGVDYKFKF